MIFEARANKEGTGLEFPTQRARREFKEFLVKHKGIILSIEPQLPESRDMREFYHGAVLRLWVYLDGKNYLDSDICKSYHELAKVEFNGEIIHTKGKVVKVGKSSRGQLKDMIERVIDDLEENYGIDRKLCLDPAHYKDFKARVYMNGNYDTYIDYLKDLKRVPVIHIK